MNRTAQPLALDAPDYRTALLAMRSEAMANLGGKFDTTASMGRSTEDQAQLSQDEFLQLRLNSLDYNKLRQLDAALRRLNEGEYGVCRACEESIPARRLQVIPWAEYCVQCQDRVANGDASEEDTGQLYSHFSTH